MSYRIDIIAITFFTYYRIIFILDKTNKVPSTCIS